MINPQTSLNCAGILLDLSEPLVMGILNVTPDSFYDGGQHNTVDKAVKQAERMLEAGASIIDIGGMSSRPGAEIIDQEEELRRVIPIIKAIRYRFPDTVLSIDTVNAEVARQAILEGGGMINDISAGSIDAALIKTVVKMKVPYVLMHMQGVPENMQEGVQYEDVVAQVLDFLIAKVGELREQGLGDIILDVGFGFGKRIEDNYQLLRNLEVFKIPGLPLLLGVSRKSMIYKLLDINPEESLSATSALHLYALQKGANILRVHDVREAMQCIQLWKQINQH